MPRGVFVLYFVLWGVKYGSFCRAARSLAVPVRQHGGGLFVFKRGAMLAHICVGGPPAGKTDAPAAGAANRDKPQHLKPY